MPDKITVTHTVDAENRDLYTVSAWTLRELATVLGIEEDRFFVKFDKNLRDQQRLQKLNRRMNTPEAVRQRDIDPLTGGGTRGKIAMPGVLSVKVGFAFHHLQAAALYAREVHRIENEHAGEAYGNFFTEIIWQASSSIIMSLAALEGNINEIIDGAAENNVGRIETQCGDLLRERKRVLDKYVKLAVILDREFDEGAHQWQNIKLLNEFRNILVHFSPEWSHQNGTHSKFSKKLDTKIKRSPFVSGSLFPHQFLSYACVKWAVRSAIDFEAYYAQKLGLQSQFAKFISPPINLP